MKRKPRSEDRFPRTSKVDTAATLVKNSAAMFTAAALAKGGGLIVIILVARYLDPASLSIYAVVLSKAFGLLGIAAAVATSSAFLLTLDAVFVKKYLFQTKLPQAVGKPFLCAALAGRVALALMDRGCSLYWRPRREHMSFFSCNLRPSPQASVR